MKNIPLLLLLAFSCMLAASRCSKNGGDNPSTGHTDSAKRWLTTADQSSLLKPDAASLAFSSGSNSFPNIDVDSTHIFQTIDGFGYTLTGGSASVILKLSSSDRAALLHELFGSGAGAISISYLRISVGASDLNDSVFSYDDMPSGQTDTTLDHFSLDPDRGAVIPLLKEILTINPALKILGSPWSPPVWMKDNGSSKGGSLKPEYYSAYANYFVKYIQQMKSEGITIDAITPQNEPLHPGNNPSMYMTAAQEAAFIKSALGPAFSTNGLTTKIIVYDHNCDRPDYPLEVLNDAAARTFVEGSAFHLYAGDISAMGQVHDAHPEKSVYFTEQYTPSNGSFFGDLRWHLKNVIIGSMRNWGRTALEWNLANDPNFEPHTPGGCTTCKGALTIGNGVVRNVAYYIVGHASKFVPPGSVRIASNVVGAFPNVAFVTPAGKKVLIVLNDGATDGSFNIRFKGKWATASLAAGAVATFVW